MNEADLRTRRQGPGVAVGVTEELIHRLVHAFYARVRADAMLGLVFDQVIGDHWTEHLAELCDFWSSVLLMSGRCKGAPMAAHDRIPGIEPAHFDHWLGLFEEAARELCPPDAADLFVAKSRMISKSLQLGIAVARGELPPMIERLRA